MQEEIDKSAEAYGEALNQEYSQNQPTNNNDQLRQQCRDAANAKYQYDIQGVSTYSPTMRQAVLETASREQQSSFASCDSRYP
jgi:hypothetical protein